MRKSFLFLGFLICTLSLQSQSNEYDIEQGDVLILGAPSGATYSAIDFPRKNFIMKRGAIADFNSLIGKRLIVENIGTDKQGDMTATLRRKDGKKFFRFYPKVEAKLTKALNSGELKTLGNRGMNEIARI